MVQGAPQTAGRFEAEVRMYKAPPPEVSSEEFYETDPAAPYRRGFSIQNVSPLPITYAEHVIAQGHWGESLREYMRDYVHWASIGSLCELLALPENTVRLASEVDKHGLPVADFSYSMCDNDKKMISAAQTKMEQILRAAGATETMTIQRFAHLVGGCRMATSAKDGVVDANQRTFAVPNLYITDGSVLPTQGAANPALTIMALAARVADHLGAATVPDPQPESEFDVVGVDVKAYTVPTERPEADGTLAWDKTTVVVVDAADAGRCTRPGLCVWAHRHGRRHQADVDAARCQSGCP